MRPENVSEVVVGVPLLGYNMIKGGIWIRET